MVIDNSTLNKIAIIEKNNNIQLLETIFGFISALSCLALAPQVRKNYKDKRVEVAMGAIAMYFCTSVAFVGYTLINALT